MVAAKKRGKPYIFDVDNPPVRNKQWAATVARLARNKLKLEREQQPKPDHRGLTFVSCENTTVIEYPEVDGNADADIDVYARRDALVVGEDANSSNSNGCDPHEREKRHDINSVACGDARVSLPWYGCGMTGHECRGLQIPKPQEQDPAVEEQKRKLIQARSSAGTTNAPNTKKKAFVNSPLENPVEKYWNEQEQEQEQEGDDEDKFEADDDDERSSSGSSDFAIDFKRDICASSATIDGSSLIKNQCEDRYITLDPLAIDIVSNSSSLCYITGVFDGHSGSRCADYLVSHIKSNILSVFRQHVRILEARSRGGSLRHCDLLDPCLEVSALMYACQKAFEMIDKNFLDIAKKTDMADGSTACVALLYGPDDNGCLRIITANVGDSKVILVSKDKESDGLIATTLTEQHKPNTPSEKQRILRAGGSVRFLQGAWRAVVQHRKGQYALATSRSFGDLHLKQPYAIVTSEPHVAVYTVDFDADLFLLVVTDGVGDFVDNDTLANTAWTSLKRHKHDPAMASQDIVNLANIKGSLDDKSATVVAFTWNYAKDVQENNVSDAHGSEPEANVVANALEAVAEPPEIIEKQEQEEGANEECDDMFA